GLALTKRLIQMHGGTIAARSAGMGQGTTFEIRLPLAAAPSATPDSAPVPLRAVPTRIMIVDDNRDSTDSLAALLKLEGHEVRTAYAAREALERAATWKPAVVLLDVGMPEMDGYELATRLRAMTELQSTRFIFLSGYGQPEDLKRTAAAGFAHHLVKPVDLSSLAAAIAGAPRA
ncbi:MAG TPA: response regulator, partial [Candidatus Binataceae bacterium]|nr:response regulator [Candidatus Binataceae bacterium]